MSTETTDIATTGGLTAEQRKDAARLAAVGMKPDRIAAAIGLAPGPAAEFALMAETPGSEVARLIEEGRISGMAVPQIKLQEAASAGNIDAAKALQRVQRANRLEELIFNMDEDESAI